MNIIKNKNTGTIPSLRNGYFRDEFLSAFDQLFDDFVNQSNDYFKIHYGGDFFSKGSYPKVDVIQYENSIVIEAEIPGVEKEDINIELSDSVLVISGQKRKTTDYIEGEIVHKELKKSSFSRSFKLGPNLKPDAIDAKFKNGLLTVTIEKIVKSPPPPQKTEIRKIDIT